jgi:hypothetical protein|tara:strand:+ start:110 stop:271 length:162 start_codon:yes stop_codon:yes gene_type:complete
MINNFGIEEIRNSRIRELDKFERFGNWGILRSLRSCHTGKKQRIMSSSIKANK